MIQKGVFLLSKAVFSVLRVLLVKDANDVTIQECGSVLCIMKKLT